MFNNNRQNFAQVLTHGRLGDLPQQLADERGEGSIPPPLGIAPQGGAYGREGNGGQAPVVFDQSQWSYITFVANIQPSLVQNSTLRKFLLIQNKNLTGTMYLGFGYQPTQINGLNLLPQTGYEPFRYPTNEIYVSASEDGVIGLLIYGT